ncbi:DUF1266 domain-containing protein [Chryseobacterium sp. BIGb0232]|uniref:DUF1266 domain-containing protein n=1 Tax=Chryseobacterium sp. BIGb0232 TaxID=2940598 RepID=UPI000F463697|nr:DUF1266 domain-containing protein [Chryseobacterium sp. BIGb0232]MCS4300999.1 hypothetical protein [Chryseobacterium sp. BIGb0232]ROS20135.1 uncharacterized protein DUF1266 [Chryseobacterium nakagawai]
MGILSKFLSSFKSIRLNDKNTVSGYLLDHLLIGSMYAEQQSAYLNSYETGVNRSDIIKLIETYWGISDQNQAIETLQSLHDRNQDENLDIVYKAFENPENYVDILRSNLSNEDEAFEYYLDHFRKLRKVVPELIEQKIITDFSQLKKIKDSGWNYGRSVFLARCCYELGYISEKELIEYLAKSHRELKKYCSTWKEYTISYIFGRAIWGGGNNNGMVQIADDLLNNNRSPLKNKTYL